MEDKGSELIGSLLEQRYRVDAPLARGGMSAVYRGLDTRLDRPVAIKVMDSRFAADPEFVLRFEREARSAAKIHHPNVVAVHDQGLDGDHVYLVMELVSGATLRDLLTGRGALPVPLAVSIMEPVLSALAAAHEAGLIHRDVKPENVLIGEGGVVKVADFGLVRAISSVGTTKSSVILGTVSYLSPEQVTTGAATARGDVYSAGIVLYEMLTGAPPYRGDNVLSVAYRHVNDDVPPPSGAASGIPPALDELVVRATRREPGARPVDGAAFLDELRRVRAALSLPRMRVPVPVPVPDETVPVSSVIEKAESAARAVDPADAPTEKSRPVAPAEDDPEATIRVRAVQAAVPHSATVVRQVPPGFSAAGPQGTRAMLRSDLEKVIDSQRRQPPTGPHGIPSQQHQGGPNGYQGPPSGPPTGPQAAQSPGAARNRRFALLGIVGVLVVALVATGIWWFSAGRYTEVPTVQGQDAAAAEQALREANLSPQRSTVRHNRIEPGVVIGTEPGAGAEALRGDEVRLIVSSGKPIVPEVTPGASREEAEAAIRAAELQPQSDDGKNVYDEGVPKDRVVRLDPGAGTKLDIGQRVVIVLSRGPAPKPIPDVRNRTRDEAFQALQSAGFEPYDGAGEFNAEIDGGRVVRTDPPADTKVDASGSKRVAVVVSTAVTVPDLAGKSVAEAQALLQPLQLQLELQPFSNGNGRIFTQSPGANTRVEKGGKVSVFAF